MNAAEREQRRHDLVEDTLARAMFGPIVDLAGMADDLLAQLAEIDAPAAVAR